MRLIRTMKITMAAILIALVITLLFYSIIVRTAHAGQDFSVGVYGGELLQSHSECDGNHCLDGLYLLGVTVDYDIFDSRNFTFRPGAAYYQLTYDESYRETSKHPREDTVTKTKDLFALTAKGGVILWDVVEPYGILGLGNLDTLIYGYGVSLKLNDNFSFDAEALYFTAECDQHEGYALGVRYSF